MMAKLATADEWFISEIVHTAVLSLDAEGSLSRPFG
jgi:hypothetical protein